MGLAALGGFMQYQQIGAQADAQQAMYNAQAQVDEQNAKIQARRNESIADQYAQEDMKLNQRARLARGQAAAAMGSSGIDSAFGTGLDVMSGIEDAYKQDKMNLLSNQRMDNYEGRVAESNYINKANANRAASSNVAAQARMAKMSTILGTASSIYGAYQGGGSRSGNGSTSLGDVYGRGYSSIYDYNTGGISKPRLGKQQKWGVW